MQLHKHKGKYSEEAGNIRYDSRLREKGGGSLEGQPLCTFRDLAKKAGVELRQFKVNDGIGESWQDVMNRAESFINEISETCMN
jgi:broad specificity phosphatase PhoE